MDIISGGPVKLRRGWAKIPFAGKKAHYWEEITFDSAYIDKHGRVRFYESLCGMEAQTDNQRPALEPGNWPKCKRCMNISKH